MSSDYKEAGALLQRRERPKRKEKTKKVMGLELLKLNYKDFSSEVTWQNAGGLTEPGLPAGIPVFSPKAVASSQGSV